MPSPCRGRSRPPPGGWRWPSVSSWMTHTPRLDQPRRAPDQPGRVERGAVRRVGAAEDGGGPEPCRRLGRREQAEVALVDAAGSGRRHLVPGSLPLGRRAGQGHRPAPGEAAVDGLGARQTRSTSSTVATMARRMAAPAPGPHCRSMRATEAAKRAEHQPPLRPEAPKPTISRSRTTMRSSGVGLGQVVGRPQPGEATTHDGHVDIGVARQRRPPLQRGRGAVPPQRRACPSRTRSCPWSRPDRPRRRLRPGRAQICFQASVRTERRTDVMYSNSSCAAGERAGPAGRRGRRGRRPGR